jgi:hypothetical protein
VSYLFLAPTSGFTIIDHEGNLVHSLNEVDDPTRSCLGMHGTGVTGTSTFTFACDQDHGGILIMNYDGVFGYSSRALTYPEPFGTHRTGHLTGHPKSSFVLGDFSDGQADSHHLMVFNPHIDSNISTGQLEELKYCSFDFERAAGELVTSWLPNGNLRVYSIDPSWMLIAEVQVFPNMTECTDTVMAPGEGSAFVARGKELKACDISDLSNIIITTHSLNVTAASAAVAGIPDGYACSGPQIPRKPHSSSAISSGWVVIHHEPHQVVVPGSDAQLAVVLALRRDIATALAIPLNRVYVGEVAKI